MKYRGEKYNSMWDWTTWLLLGIVALCCIWPCFTDDGIAPIIIGFIALAFMLICFLGIYYKIDGDNLVVYTFFRPTAFPINKIKTIRHTNSVLSSPATSLTHRLAITFNDRMILRSSTPLIISPVRQDEFIRRLIALNPNIVY